MPEGQRPPAERIEEIQGELSLEEGSRDAQRHLTILRALRKDPNQGSAIERATALAIQAFGERIKDLRVRLATAGGDAQVNWDSVPKTAEGMAQAAAELELRLAQLRAKQEERPS